MSKSTRTISKSPTVSPVAPVTADPARTPAASPAVPAASAAAAAPAVNAIEAPVAKGPATVTVTVTAEPATADAAAPKVATPKVATPMAATPKAASPKAEAPKAEAPKAEAPKPATPVAPPLKEVAAKPAAPKAKPAAETSSAAKTSAPDPVAPFKIVQEQVRASAEKGIAQFRDRYATMKEKAETATTGLEESLQAVRDGTKTFNMKVFDLFQAQTLAGFSHMQALFAAKSVEDAVKLQQAFTAGQITSMQVQAREFAELARKLSSDVTEPVKTSVVVALRA